MKDKTMYNSAEAAAALGVSDQTIRSYVDNNLIVAERTGLRRIIRISEAELRRFAEQHQIRFQSKS